MYWTVVEETGVGPGTGCDLRGLRLDWARVQVHMGARRTSAQLRDLAGVSVCLNNMSFFSRLVDDLEGVLRDTSDLSFYW